MPRKSLFIAIFVMMIALLFSVETALAQQKKDKPAAMQERSLYQRLGGYDAIAAVVDDFIARLLTDTQLSHFFSGHSLDSKKHIRQLIVEQLCMAAGGPCFYTGRSMKASHEGLNITESDWQAAVKQLAASLEKFRAPQKEKDEVLTAVSSFKADIVTPQ